MHLAVLLFERIRQRPVSPRALGVGAEGAALGTTVIVWRQGAGRRVSVKGRRGVWMDGETWMVAEVKIVRAGDQCLVTVDLHSR